MGLRPAAELTFIAALADSAPVAIYHADASGRLTYVNRLYREMLGLSPEQNLDDWAQGVHPSDRERMQASWADFCQRPRAVQFQWRSRSDSGSVRFLSETVVAVAASCAGGFVGTITDVTELKEAQAEVEKLHRQLVDGSRQAGRAEVATSVLHNVGNVLNSVNVSASVVVDQVRKSTADGLTRIAALLREAATDVNFFTVDERGRRLPGYVDKLAAQIHTEQGKTLAELATLQRNIEHIREIVAMQQGYAKQGGVSEMVQVADLVEESLRLNDAAQAHDGVTLQRDFQPVGPIVVDRHRVLPILVNLMRNAEHACSASRNAPKRMLLRIAAGGRGVRISVEDNGVGIAPEHLGLIFTHGFTTKAAGHGFGLHSGALAARELGGELQVVSQGIERGACFTLDLPLQPPVHHG